MNLGEPDQAFSLRFIPNDGIGLAREEFIIANNIKIHPLALINYKRLPLEVRKKINRLTIGFKNKTQFFVEKLAEGIGKIGAAFYPKPVIIRFSDFKSNEYAQLIGGEFFEPKEENPMLGWRGAARYYDPKFKEAFLLECQAIKKVREKFGLKNIWAMVPFCRTVEEGRKVLEIMKGAGLEKEKDGLKIIVMCEIPSNVVLADKFLEIFDGMSIGSNDLTQLVLGLDRDSAQVSKVGDERNPAVKKMIVKVIKECKKRKKYVGICGEAASIPEFARFLVNCGIESMSVNPDSVIKTILAVVDEEKKIKKK
jgi:pyruvate,water dikinase